MTPKTLFSPKRIALFILVLFLLLGFGQRIWESIHYTYIPTLAPSDNLDEYIHRRISIIGRYRGPKGINDDFGLVQFGDEPIEFCAGRDALQLLEGGDAIRVTGELIGPAKADGPLPYPRTILRARVEKTH
jgi:hypothetical protein